MDVRGRRLRKQSDDAVAFTSSTGPDGRIAPHVVAVNMAHMLSLVESGAVRRPVGKRILSFLSGYTPNSNPSSGTEDFHQQLEQEATDALGVKVAGYLNLGKSRNDQVATAIRMELRRTVLELIENVIDLQESLLALARRYGAILIPGYTHLQRAQPITLAHYSFAHLEAHQRSVERLFQLYGRVNISPMGSAALGGTSVGIDRKAEAELLGFEGTTVNAMDSVASRDLLIEALACATVVMIDVSRMAEEQILWASREFGFVELSDRYSASSSIMPQKKNPVVAEIARAKAGSVMGRLVSVCAILKALPFAYNLDLQEATPHLWSGLDDTIDSVRMLGLSLSTLKVVGEDASNSLRNDFSTATALANHLVTENSLSFREAHSVVGELVRSSLESGVPFEEVVVMELPKVSKKVGKTITMDRSTAESVLDPHSFVEAIATAGGSNPRFIPEELERCAESLRKNRKRLAAKTSSLEESAKALRQISHSMSREVKSKR